MDCIQTTTWHLSYFLFLILFAIHVMVATVWHLQCVMGFLFFEQHIDEVYLITKWHLMINPHHLKGTSLYIVFIYNLGATYAIADNLMAP